MKGFGDKNQSKNRNIDNEKKKSSIEQILNKAFNLQAQGKNHFEFSLSDCQDHWHELCAQPLL